MSQRRNHACREGDQRVTMSAEVIMCAEKVTMSAEKCDHECS